MKIFVFAILILSFFQPLPAVPTLTGYQVILKSNVYIEDICSQGGVHTYVIHAARIYKWNYVTNGFDYFLGPEYFNIGLWWSYNLISIACTGSGILYVCANEAPWIFRYIPGSGWFGFNGTNLAQCYKVKVDYNHTRVYVGREDTLINNLQYFSTSSNSWVNVGSSNTWAITCDDTGILYLN